MSIYDKWNKVVADKDIAQKEKKLAENQEKTYKELPSGEYIVKLEKAEVVKTSWVTEQISIDFVITEGDYEKYHIFFNGTFDDHFAHGYEATSKFLADLLENEVTAAVIWGILENKDSANDFLMDVAEACEDLEFLIDYKVVESKKLNPNTNKPYVNKFYSVKEIYDV